MPSESEPVQMGVGISSKRNGKRADLPGGINRWQLLNWGGLRFAPKVSCSDLHEAFTQVKGQSSVVSLRDQPCSLCLASSRAAMRLRPLLAPVTIARPDLSRISSAVH